MRGPGDGIVCEKLPVEELGGLGIPARTITNFASSTNGWMGPLLQWLAWKMFYNV
jgi:hypothetical protein